MVVKKVTIFIAKIYIAICIVIFTTRLIFGLAFSIPVKFNIDFMQNSYCAEIGGVWNSSMQVCEVSRKNQNLQKQN
jgi:hypothetical protein